MNQNSQLLMDKIHFFWQMIRNTSGKHEILFILSVREHKKKKRKKESFLAGHSARALPPPLPVSGTMAIWKYFYIIDIYMYLKPVNPDTENDIKKIKKCPLKKSCTAETGKLKKIKCTRITPNFKKNIFIQFFISKYSAS